ncbi:MAG: tetratricopeptide repeat protein [Clostridia bacterium]
MRRAVLAAFLAAAAACAGCTGGSAWEAKPLDPDADLVTINREAELAYESGEAAKAEALYKSLVRKMPNDAETWFRLGNLYARNNRPDEAANAYQKALLANNADPRAWHNLGVVRLRQAWAAMLQAYDNLKSGDPLYESVEATLRDLEKIPLIEPDAKAREKKP